MKTQVSRFDVSTQIMFGRSVWLLEVCLVLLLAINITEGCDRGSGRRKPHPSKTCKFLVAIGTFGGYKSGTDDTIEIEIGDDPPIELDKKNHDDFESGNIDKFVVSATCYPTPKSVRLISRGYWHLGKLCLGNNWLVQNVTLTRYSSKVWTGMCLRYHRIDCRHRAAKCILK